MKRVLLLRVVSFLTHFDRSPQGRSLGTSASPLSAPSSRTSQLTSQLANCSFSARSSTSAGLPSQSPRGWQCRAPSCAQRRGLELSK